MPETTPEVETLTEVLCNLAGMDPNNDSTWKIYQAEACGLVAAADRGEVERWW